MSYYEPYHTCSYNTMTLDELRLKSLRRRSEGIRNVDKAFDQAQQKVQEQAENRNSSLEARLSRLNELKNKAEDDAKKVTEYKVKSDFKSENFLKRTNVSAPKRYESPKEPERIKPREKEPEVVKAKEPEVVQQKEPEVVKTQEPEVVKTQEPEIVKTKEPQVVKTKEQEKSKSKEPKIDQLPESEAKKVPEISETKEKNVPVEHQKEESKTESTNAKTSEPTEQKSESKENSGISEKSNNEEVKKGAKPPELNIVPAESNGQGDKIDQILECDSVLDASSKCLSPFEQNLVAFGQHFNFIPSPEPEKWESSESEEEVQEEEVVEIIEEELTPYQAALKKKYEEEVCTTKTASWGGDKQKAKFDMSFLDVNQGEEIIHGNLFTQFKDWIRAIREEEIGEKALVSIKSHQNDPVNDDNIRIDPHPVFKDRNDLIYIGEKNSLAKPHGDGEVNYQNGDTFKGEFLNGERHGRGQLAVSSENHLLHTVASIEGQYVHDHLEGEAKIIHKNGNIQHAFCSKGCLHGISKLFDKDYNIIEMGWYHSGHKEGHFWKFLTGGSLLLGGVTETGKIGGDDVIYIYSDLKTCFKGTFVDEQMLMGQACYIEVALKKKDIYFIKTTTPKGPKYRYDPATNDQMCELDPLLPDPYEFNCIYIKQSRMKNAGEGIFALRDLYKGEIVSFYNGIRMKSNELDSKSDEWEKNAYKIMDLLGKDEKGLEGVIDIPNEYISLEKYKASLSHKANHSFEPNAKFVLFHHARFGLIPSLMITTDAVAHDKEVLVSYDYAMDESPPWYQDLYTQNMLNMYQESKNFEG